MTVATSSVERGARHISSAWTALLQQEQGTPSDIMPVVAGSVTATWVQQLIKFCGRMLTFEQLQPQQAFDDYLMTNVLKVVRYYKRTGRVLPEDIDGVVEELITQDRPNGARRLEARYEDAHKIRVAFFKRLIDLAVTACGIEEVQEAHFQDIELELIISYHMTAARVVQQAASSD